MTEEAPGRGGEGLRPPGSPGGGGSCWSVPRLGGATAGVGWGTSEGAHLSRKTHAGAAPVAVEAFSQGVGRMHFGGVDRGRHAATPWGRVGGRVPSRSGGRWEEEV